ncbi:MAG: hypothetical protein HDT16_05595 [Oscillibacter sp.]|nr:hypothetical protein [Oscillibacter sp.]
MKKYIAVSLCICLLLTLSATAFASESAPDFQAEYEAIHGEAPVATDFSYDADYKAAYDLWFSGLVSYIDRRTTEENQKTAQEAAQQPVSENPPETNESVGSNHVVSSDHVDPPVDTGPVDKYPVGSRVDAAGNVYAASGELLSPGTTPASLPLVEDSPVDQTVEGSGPLAVTSPTWYVEDLRPANAPTEALTGLKSLVTSIFGEYTPVTTTSVISETVGTDTHQYLVETVAPGAAGVDYEWIAGVVFFAILLFCFMKLLGGIVS